ncbi:hypothetical protein CL652_00335 [bacterium]|nr:hypothetical protein [bacterium]
MIFCWLKAKESKMAKARNLGLSYVERKVLHLIRTFGAGQAGTHPITGAAITAERCKEIGVKMVRQPRLEAFAKQGY